MEIVVKNGGAPYTGSTVPNLVHLWGTRGPISVRGRARDTRGQDASAWRISLPSLLRSNWNFLVLPESEFEIRTTNKRVRN